MFHKQNLKNILETVFKNKINLLVFISTIAISYGLLAIFSNISLLSSALTSLNFSLFANLGRNLILGYPGTLSTFNLSVTVLLSVLIGLNVALIVDNLRKSLSLNISQSGSILGVMIAPVISICSVCVAGISFAGLSISIAFLPFGGLELSVLSAALLTFSAFWITENNQQAVCAV